MEPILILIVLGLGGWILLQKIQAAPPAIEPAAAVPPEPVPSSAAADILNLGAGFIESGGTAAAATMTGAQLGAMTIAGGATAVEAGASGAIAAALLGGGPIGAAIAGTISIFAEQAELGEHIDLRNTIWQFLLPVELNEWQKKKDHSETNWWDANAHRATRNYEEALIAKYTSATGVENFEGRASYYVKTGYTRDLTQEGLAWLHARGFVYVPPTAAEVEATETLKLATMISASTMRRALQHLTAAQREVLTEEERQALYATWYSGLTDSEKKLYGLT